MRPGTFIIKVNSKFDFMLSWCTPAKLAFLLIVNDVLAEKVIVREHYRRSQLRQVFLHPHHFLFKNFLTGHFLLNSNSEKTNRWVIQAHDKQKVKSIWQLQQLLFITELVLLTVLMICCCLLTIWDSVILLLLDWTGDIDSVD